ncbi:peptidase M15 [bacterium]|nr:peptidase M15 [bacterium]
MTKLSDHFSLEELTYSDLAVRHGIDNNPNGDIVVNLTRLAKLLERVRLLLNKPIHINSAYRSPEVNNLLGSKPTSQHCVGCAADIKVGSMTPDQVVKAIVHSDIPYDQVIREFDSWVHISIPNNETVKPRKQALIIDKTGTHPYA